MTATPMRIDVTGALVPLTADEITQRQKDADAAANAVTAASMRLDFLTFMTLFTTAEQTAIVNSADPRVRLFSLMAAGAQYVDLTDPRVVSGTQLLESLGLVVKGRATQVLAGQAAPSN
ncbi:hypothetical protein MKK88_05725 [Methylobacterium sp. E-005]|uniref:hypothetical protein n=1 Tax=Methylobacterium sp. E-005 TaxID=2836549 RepID=UPI001FBB4645|nr:hypothetical protein [Methylobacterium sp. E-005]MCJ2085493.1 hypothetical protein [Methylobacterium sp. E-005]